MCHILLYTMSVNEWMTLNKNKQVKKSPSEKNIQLKASQDDELKKFGIEKNEFNLVRKKSTELKKSSEIEWIPDKLKSFSDPNMPIKIIRSKSTITLSGVNDDN